MGIFTLAKAFPDTLQDCAMHGAGAQTPPQMPLRLARQGVSQHPHSETYERQTSFSRKEDLVTSKVAAAPEMDELAYKILLPVSISFLAMRVYLVLHSAAGPAMAIVSRVADFLGTLPL